MKCSARHEHGTKKGLSLLRDSNPWPPGYRCRALLTSYQANWKLVTHMISSQLAWKLGWLRTAPVLQGHGRESDLRLRLFFRLYCRNCLLVSCEDNCDDLSWLEIYIGIKKAPKGSNCTLVIICYSDVQLDNDNGYIAWSDTLLYWTGISNNLPEVLIVQIERRDLGT